jgi:hypothetical protein
MTRNNYLTGGRGKRPSRFHIMIILLGIIACQCKKDAVTIILHFATKNVFTTRCICTVRSVGSPKNVLNC